MSSVNRRQFLKGLLGGLAQTAGTVVLAQTVLASEQIPGSDKDGASSAEGNIKERADQFAETAVESSETEAESLGGFLNGGFRNGGFVNGGFRNGSFANGGFHNGGGGGFRNGAFVNGGGGGGFRNGAFVNGGFRN